MMNLMNDWDELLNEQTEMEYMSRLRTFLKEEYATQTVYPPMSDMFNALKCTPYHSVKIVLIGQDPYHQPGQAMGMSFSVREGVTIPPSLRNIYREIETTTGHKQPANGDLTRWAVQGVLLLNAVLTVRRGEPGSHRGKGWEQFTDSIIHLLNQRAEPIVFLLWGADAKRKQELITNPVHKVLTAAHPSPFSADKGFFGCDHFRKANQLIEENGGTPIEW